MAPRPHMRDKCQIGRRDGVTEGREPVEVWSYSPEIRCRFVRTSTREVLDGDIHGLSDVKIHIPAGETISDSSQIKVTRRNGQDVMAAEYYRVMGEPWFLENNRVIVCNCVSVPAGAEA
jgi:hypothetical protein